MATKPKSASKPTWQKSSPELVALFEDLAPKDPGVVHKKMFGYPCCFVNGNLFTGLHQETIIFRLPDQEQAAFLKLKSAAPFQPMPGRTMKGYTALHNPTQASHAALSRWFARSLEFAESLPAKEPRNTPAPAVKKKTSRKQPSRKQPG